MRYFYAKYIKRFIDIVISLLGLIILSPVMLVVAVLVGKKLGKPVIYKQQRPGYKEKIFWLYKFRSMSDARDEKGELLPDEIRLGEFGKKLRALSLDELPQLWNILKGDMSIIGPRPLLVSYLDRYSEEQHRRHDVRPGLFGLAGVNGRNAQSWESKFAYDIEYVDNISFKLDIQIFFKCIYTVLSRKGVAEEGRETASEFKGKQ
jgi:undecaprenyl phosphate N,N'-diacetylbacillosamine 1-phosphate transferase